MWYSLPWAYTSSLHGMNCQHNMEYLACNSAQGPHLMQVGYYKKRLLYCIAGLDRGFAANKLAATTVEGAVDSLITEVGAPVILGWSTGRSSILKG